MPNPAQLAQNLDGPARLQRAMITSLAAVLAALVPLLPFHEEPAPAVSAPSTELEAPRSIAWYGTWELGQKEAERSGRPILLMSAAPRCHDVPGLW